MISLSSEWSVCSCCRTISFHGKSVCIIVKRVLHPLFLFHFISYTLPDKETGDQEGYKSEGKRRDEWKSVKEKNRMETKTETGCKKQDWGRKGRKESEQEKESFS